MRGFPAVAAVVALMALMALAACGGGTTYMTQQSWNAAMSETYTPGMPAAIVEESVTRAGMTFEVEPEPFRRLPRSVVGDGSGTWRRVTTVENAAGCDLSRTVYMLFDTQEKLVKVHPGDSRCL